MSFLLDTNIISESIKARPEAKVVRWLVGQSDSDLYLSVLTIGEIERGIEQSNDVRRKHNLRRWLEQTKAAFGGRILPIDEQVAVTWGKALAAAGRPMPMVDSLLAATALTHDMTLVTRNAADVDYPNLSVLNPWD